MRPVASSPGDSITYLLFAVGRAILSSRRKVDPEVIVRRSLSRYEQDVALAYAMLVLRNSALPTCAAIIVQATVKADMNVN